MASKAGDHCQNHNPTSATTSSDRRSDTSASSSGAAAYIPRRVRLAPSGVGTTKARIAANPYITAAVRTRWCRAGTSTTASAPTASVPTSASHRNGNDATLRVQHGDGEHRRQRRRRQQGEASPLTAPLDPGPGDEHDGEEGADDRARRRRGDGQHDGEDRAPALGGDERTERRW